MFARFFSQSLNDSEENIPFLEEVIIETNDLRNTSQNTPKLFLSDEIFACIKILENAKNRTIPLNKKKIAEIYYFYRQIYYFQATLNLVLTGASVYPFYSSIHSLLNIYQSLTDQIKNFKNLLVNEKSQIATELASECNTTHSDDPAFDEICHTLTTRLNTQNFWWNDEKKSHHNLGCGELEQDRNKLIPGPREIDFISSDPTFDVKDFCNPNYFSNQSVDIPEICLERKWELCNIQQKLEGYWTEDLSDAAADLLDSKTAALDRLSENEMDFNRLKKTNYDNETSFTLPGITLLAGSIGFACITYLIILIIKLKNAMREYKNDVAKADDLDCCIDSQSLNRIINITSRLNISLKEAKIDPIINQLKTKLCEIQDRRHLRLTFLKGFKQEMEKLNNADKGAWHDIYKIILTHAELAPTQQAPK